MWDYLLAPLHIKMVLQSCINEALQGRRHSVAFLLSFRVQFKKKGERFGFGATGANFAQHLSLAYVCFCIKRVLIWLLGYLTPFDIGFFRSVNYGDDPPPPHHNFVVIAPRIKKFGTSIKLDVYYTMAAKNWNVATIT